MFSYGAALSQPHRRLRMPCGRVRRASLSLTHAFVRLLYVTVCMSYNVAVLVIRVSFHFIVFHSKWMWNLLAYLGCSPMQASKKQNIENGR